MIRDATESDLESIVGIYNAAIPGRMATADTEPVSAESRRVWLRDRDFTLMSTSARGSSKINSSGDAVRGFLNRLNATQIARETAP